MPVWPALAALIAVAFDLSGGMCPFDINLDILEPCSELGNGEIGLFDPTSQRSVNYETRCQAD